MLLKIKKLFASKIDGYFYKELIPNFLFGVFFFTVLLLLNELFYLARLYFNENVPFGQVMYLLVNLTPFILTYSLPFGILPAYLLTMGRLSQDSEFVAMRACGISAIRIILPGLLFGIFMTLFIFVFKDKVIVQSFTNFVRLRAKIVSQKPAVELKEKAFAQVGSYKISFDRQVSHANYQVLYNIHLIDVNGRKTIRAEKGRAISDPDNPEHYILKFQNGNISQVVKYKDGNGKDKDHFFISSFKYLSLNTYVNLPKEYYNKNADMMTIKELREKISKTSKVPLTNILKYKLDKNNILEARKKIEQQYHVKLKGLDSQMLLKKKKDLDNILRSKDQAIKRLEKQISGQERSLPYHFLMKYYERYTMPVAALVFALLTLALGMYTARSGKGEGLGISFVIMITYYGLKVGVDNFILKRTISPLFEWFPNILFLTIGLVLLIKKVRE